MLGHMKLPNLRFKEGQQENSLLAFLRTDEALSLFDKSVQ